MSVDTSEAKQGVDFLKRMQDSIIRFLSQKLGKIGRLAAERLTKAGFGTAKAIYTGNFARAAIQAVEKDGPSNTMSALGEFDYAECSEIVKRAEEKNVKIAIVEKEPGEEASNKRLSVKDVKKLQELEEKIAQQKIDVRKLENKMNKKPEKYRMEYNLERQRLSEYIDELDDLQKNGNGSTYTIYVNASQRGFIKEIKKTLMNQDDKQLQKDWEKDKEKALEKGVTFDEYKTLRDTFTGSSSRLDMERMMQKKEGNYGTLDAYDFAFKNKKPYITFNEDLEKSASIASQAHENAGDDKVAVLVPPARDKEVKGEIKKIPPTEAQIMVPVDKIASFIGTHYSNDKKKLPQTMLIHSEHECKEIKDISEYNSMSFEMPFDGRIGEFMNTLDNVSGDSKKDYIAAITDIDMDKNTCRVSVHSNLPPYQLQTKMATIHAKEYKAEIRDEDLSFDLHTRNLSKIFKTREGIMLEKSQEYTNIRSDDNAMNLVSHVNSEHKDYPDVMKTTAQLLKQGYAAKEAQNIVETLFGKDAFINDDKVLGDKDSIGDREIPMDMFER